LLRRKRRTREDKKKEVPHENIEKLLKEMNLTESIPKLKEHDIAEPEVFFELSEDKMIELLEIKTEGRKMRFKDKIKDVKEKHEKAMAKKEAVEEGEDVVKESFEALQRKATVIF
jgi:hypothetical protein